MSFSYNHENFNFYNYGLPNKTKSEEIINFEDNKKQNIQISNNNKENDCKCCNVKIKINVFNQYLSPEKENKKYSKNWIKLKNLVKTVSKFYKYDIIPIKEIDIDHNLKDYKERLFNYSPLKKNSKIKQERKSNSNLMKRINLKILSDDYYQSLQKYNNFDFQNNLIIPFKKQSSPNKIKNILQTINNKNNLNLIDESDADNITIEMNKINIIERIKNYIIE